MTRLHIMDTAVLLRVFFERGGLLGTTYAIQCGAFIPAISGDGVIAAKASFTGKVGGNITSVSLCGRCSSKCSTGYLKNSNNSTSVHQYLHSN